MKARKLLEGSSYGPEKLKQIYRAFDQAWEAIKPVVESSPLAHEAARLKLANTILSIATDENLDRGQDTSEASPAPRPARDATSA